jgi:DNA-binding MarR family transcriptional regulator
MADGPPDVLGLLFRRLLRVRGVLDPARTLPGLAASVSEVITLDQLAGGPATQQELAGALGLEKSTVSRLVEGMAAKGWVERARDPANRRYQVVRVTGSGLRVAAEIGEAMRRRHERILAALTPAERAAMDVALPALVRALAEEAAGHE